MTDELSAGALRLTLARGGEAVVHELDGERIVLMATIASAPGSRVDGVLDSGEAIRFKVHRCRREEAGFAMDGRMLNLTRELRLCIQERLGRGVSVAR